MDMFGRTIFALPRGWRSLAASLALGLAGAGAWAAPLPVSTGEYKLPAAVDPTVTADMATELWAQVWQPASGGPYPLLVFLHGNHATCGHYEASLGIRIDDNTDYTYTGTCPPGYVVAPSHMGYAYVAQDLAAQGFVVVSINANRGVNAAPGVADDEGLNLRRGRLILRHLQYLAELNAGTALPPAESTVALLGMLQFAHIGLMGHSRGGEGARAAVEQYKEAGSAWPTRIGPVTFEALFEIAPVDGQTSRTLDAEELAWNVLIGGCDGDVYDWEGVRVFDRMLKRSSEVRLLPKSTFLVYGANHNFFNTEWQQSDALGCINQPRYYARRGGDLQRRTSYATLIDFMHAHVGPTAVPKRALGFDPSYPLDAELPRSTTYARGFTATPKATANLVIDDFDRPTGTSTAGVASLAGGLQDYAHGPAGASAHQPPQRAALLRWAAAGVGTYFQTNAAAVGASRNASGYATLEFRVMLQCPTADCRLKPAKGGDVDFSIALAGPDDRLSAPVALKSVATVRWAGGTFAPMEMFQTVRVPLSAFAGFDLAALRGVRFTFDKAASRAVYLGNVRLTEAAAGPGGVTASGAAAGGASAVAATNDVNRVVAIRRIAPATIEVEVLSSRPFPIGGALPELRIGAATSRLSRGVPGTNDRLVFSVPAAEFDAIAAGTPVTLRIGGAAAWSFGGLTK